MTELVLKLRTTESGSKGDLLKAAADAIENLMAERDAMLNALYRSGSDCDLCEHNGKTPCNDELDCETCKQDCVCHRCLDGCNFVWNGKSVARNA